MLQANTLMGVRGRKGYDANIHSVAALREIGKGCSSLKTICGLRSMPPPMTHKKHSQRSKLSRIWW